MSVNQNRGTQDYSIYDTMETDELKEILRLDAEAPDGSESDIDLILYIMEVLAKRRNNNGEIGKTAHEAYEIFKQYYLPEVADAQSDDEVQEEPKVTPMRWLRGLTAAAAVLAFVFIGSLTANAFGFDILGTVAKWAQETFHFETQNQADIDEANPDRALEYESLQDALYKIEKISNLVPTWIPEGYSLFEIQIDEMPGRKTYIGTYKKGEQSIKVFVQPYLNFSPEQLERSDGLVETYQSDDITYYIFSNYNQTRAVWCNGPYECYISGELTTEELKSMIDSIMKG